MLLPGHNKLTDDAIRLAMAWAKCGSVEELLHSDEYVLSSHHLLRVGNQYPDVPCASRRVTPDGKVVLESYKTCKWSKVGRLLRGKVGHSNELYSEAYVSHKLSMSHLHSMSYVPRDTVANVRERIARAVEAFACMAFATDGDDVDVPNVFWVGQILHVIQDSYSASHTLRACTTPARTELSRLVKALVTLSTHGIVYSKYSDMSTEVVVRIIEAMSRRHAQQHHIEHLSTTSKKSVNDRVDDDISKELMNNGIQPPAKDRSKRYARNLYMSFYAQEQATQEAQRKISMSSRRRRTYDTRFSELLLKRISIPTKKKWTLRDSGLLRDVDDAGVLSNNKLERAADINTDVITFHSYNSQDTVAHALDDMISSVKATGLYTMAVVDSALVLLAYNQAIRSGDSRMHFVSDVSRLVRDGTLRIHVGCDALLTGFDIDTVVKELVTT